MKIIRKDIVYYVRYMVRFNTGINLSYIPCYNLPEQEIDVTILLSNILLYINTLIKYIFVDIVYATFTRIGCNTTPSIPSANAFGNTFFIICILPFTSAFIFMPLLLTNNPL